MTIRTRIIIGVLLIVAVGFYYLTDWVLRDLRPHYLKSMEETLIDTATLLASLVSAGSRGDSIAAGDLRAAFTDAQKRSFRARVYDVTKQEMNLRVYVTDRKGIVIFDSDHGRDEGRDYSRWRDVALTLQGRYGARASHTDPIDTASSVLYVASPVLIEGRIAGVLTVGKPTRSVSQFILGSRRDVIRAGILAALTVALLGVLLTVWVTRPIRKLTTYARAVADGRPAPFPRLGLLTSFGHSEMGVMGRALEEMREALEGKQYVERYVQTLTHELKSPLAAITGAAELLGEEMAVAERRRFINNIRTEGRRMQDIVERMLQLSVLESRKSLKSIEAIDIGRLIGAIVEEASPLLVKKGLRVQTVLAPRLGLAGELFLIRQALVNLLGNAIDFSPSNGLITITACQDEAYLDIGVADSGPGIPAYAREKIFERFYSLPRPDTGRKSSGLGLSFVREVATLHGGTVSVDNRGEGGVCARLRLPLLQPVA